MIQRLQTILLFLAAAANIVVLFSPIQFAAQATVTGDQTVRMNGSSIETSVFSAGDWQTTTAGATSNTLLLVCVIMVCVNSALLLLTIMMYSNRPRQMMMAYLGLLMIALEVGMYALGGLQLSGQLTEGVQLLKGSGEEGVTLEWGFLLPIFAMLLTWWAARRIRKDEKLVKSMDRLR